MTLEKIKQMVESVFKTDIDTDRRLREIVEARYVFFSLSRRSTGLSFKKIGDFLNRDHASVIHGINRCNTLIEVDKEFNERYLICVDKLKMAIGKKELQSLYNYHLKKARMYHRQLS